MPEIVTPTFFSQLNPSYVLEDYIVGDSNRMACSAAEKVADLPGKTSFNPLVIHGGVGLGKTHLIQGIGNASLQRGTATRVCYVTCEQFTNQYVYTLRAGTVTEFLISFYSVDLLIVDDVQFLEGKPAIQEQFFHIFNEIHGAERQIVLCMDRSPREVQDIEDRLFSRFAWGLVAEILAPGLDLREAILHHKAEERGLALSTETLREIALLVEGSGRSLEGALSRLEAHLRLGLKVDPTTVAAQLSDLVTMGQRKAPNLEDIIAGVCHHFNVREAELLGRSRRAYVALARQAGMSLARELTKHTQVYIGRRFGGRDHTTVGHACSVIEDRQGMDAQLSAKIEAIRHQLIGR